jgi:hypothetical protein
MYDLYWSCTESDHSSFCNGGNFATIFDWPQHAHTFCSRNDLISSIFVCRQVYEEARFLPYSLNKFAVWSLFTGQTWIMALSKDQRSAITTLYYQVDHASPFALDLSQQLMSSLPNLKFVGCYLISLDTLRAHERLDQPTYIASIQHIAHRRGIELVIARED